MNKFAFDIIRVNNNDMRSTYNKGDALLIKKSFNNYNTGDVIYLEYPVKDSLLTRYFFIQRIYGLPGDSIQIISKQVFLNGMQLQDTTSLKHNYFVKSIQKLDTNFREVHELYEGGEVSGEFDYSYSLTQEQADFLRQEPYISEVNLKTEKKNSYDETCYPSHPFFKWNMDHYGPLYIPRKNDTLILDTNLIKLYAPIITEHEKNILRVSQDSIIINGELTKTYIVKKNYYFVLGDNRDNANDSRSWGFLPENFIIGKVVHTIRRNR